MGSEASIPPDATLRHLIRFYLLDHGTYLGKVVDIGFLVLNLLFLAIFVASTYPVSASVQATLEMLDLVVAFIFLVEYILRLYGAVDRIAEATDPYTIADLLAILPAILVFIVPVVGVVDLAFLKVIRVVRVLRFYRFTRDAEFFFGTVTEETLRGLKFLLTVFVLLFLSSGLFYSVEVGQNPAVTTFGDAFYFTVVTLTTVGFGDLTPVTVAGRWVTVFSILAAVVLIPFQASRVVKEWTTDKVDISCPECGLRYHDPDASHCKACGHVVYQEYDSREQ
jgi:voltage-gated potassium channel